jgi:hypothetical protein
VTRTIEGSFTPSSPLLASIAELQRAIRSQDEVRPRAGPSLARILFRIGASASQPSGRYFYVQASNFVLPPGVVPTLRILSQGSRGFDVRAYRVTSATHRIC